MREWLTGHLAPCQLNDVCRFRSKPFLRVKASTYCGRGAMRYEQRLFELATPRCHACNVLQMARAAPSGTRGVVCGDEPRTHGARAPVECQECTHRPPFPRPTVLPRLPRTLQNAGSSFREWHRTRAIATHDLAGCARIRARTHHLARRRGVASLTIVGACIAGLTAALDVRDGRRALAPTARPGAHR